MGRQGSDWLSRVVIPDVYPRKSDPFKPASLPQPEYAPPDGEGSEELSYGADLYRNITSPAARPAVYQRAFNIQLTAGVAPVPIINNRFDCDSMVIDVGSTAANSVFFGYGSSVSLTSGLECRPGLPINVTPENTRELWELQRCLEAMAAIMANDRGMTPLPPFRAPRVVFNAAEYFLVAAANTTVAVMLFYVPEMQ